MRSPKELALDIAMLASCNWKAEIPAGAITDLTAVIENALREKRDEVLEEAAKLFDGELLRDIANFEIVDQIRSLKK